MIPMFSAAIAVLCYIVAAVLLWRRLQQGGSPTIAKKPILFLALAGVVVHGFVLSSQLMTPTGVNFGFSNMLSLATWFITCLLVLSSFTRPVENMGVLIFPIAAIAVLIGIAIPSTRHLSDAASGGLSLHILFSILAYSLLGMAAVQAILLSIQERHLHSRRPGGFVRALPPLETMENLLFQLIIIGFVLQSMSLLSGFVYLENMFAQHLAHKTILSAIAWSVFATLLWGHWRYGWRGRTAVRWTISGFVALLLAYFGSKYVLEIILNR